MYKWALPVRKMKEVRYEVEESSGAALDWSDEEGASRNALLFESARPMAQLYEPLFHSDDTFILQEYFVPQSRFSRWIEAVKPIYADL